MADGSGAFGNLSPGLKLRVLATTDLHMHLLPYDYLAAGPCDRRGLARTAALIQARRAEADACLLLDNGDFLQGSPMGDVIAHRSGRSQAAIHPAIAAMNALGYDAAALGNHDFNFGLRFLRRAVSQARFPVLAANLTTTRGPGFRPWTIIERTLSDGAGDRRRVRIGVAGFLPPQTGEWDQDLTPWITCADIIDTARHIVPRMRAEGAELVIALAHSGIGPLTPHPRMEHAATALAALPGIDLVIAGHTHEVFPGPHHAPAPGVDPLRGTLAGKPAVMPGYGGSHLGVIDLELRADAQGILGVTGFRVRCEPVDPALPALAQVARPVAEAHHETLRHLASRVGRSLGPITSHFALIGQDAGLRLVNQAQRWHVRRRLRGTPWQHLPILSASAPFRAGGRGGPNHYTDVPAGAISLRHLADLYAFPNRIAAICLFGAQVEDWLERSASLFCRLPPGSRDMPLLDPGFPAYNFDVIDGVSWRIDLGAPARFHADGRLADPGARRVRELRHRGLAVAPDDRFILATNTYRLASCGLFSPLVSGNQVALPRGALTRDVLRDYIRHRRRITPDPAPNWSFVPQPCSTALFATAPAARDSLPLTGPRIEPAGETSEGFALMRLFL